MRDAMTPVRDLLTAMLLCTTLMASGAAAQSTAPRPADGPRTVTIPLNEFNRLVDLSEHAAATPPPAPVPYVLSSTDLQLRVDGDAVRGTLTLEGDVLRGGTTTVTLLNGGTVLEASEGGRPLPLVMEGRHHAALIGGPGRFAAVLEWGAPLALSPGRASFDIPVPPSGTARGTIDLPGDQAEVRVNAGLITSRSVVDGRTRVEVTFDPGVTTSVSWSMRDAAPAAAAREVRAFSEVLTLVTIGDSDLRVASLVDVTVMLGEPRSFTAHLPDGYELISVTGGSLDSSAQTGTTLTLTLNNPAARRHQFLFVLERPHPGPAVLTAPTVERTAAAADPSAAQNIETTFVTLAGVQRERGEVALNGIGTIELDTPDRPGFSRIDVRELNPALQSLARESLLAAFRYHGTPGASPRLAFDVRRFGNAAVLAAVAERALVTTLVTSEGRALTEIALRIQNRAQPFLKVTLPPGATMVSVDVAGATAKPALGVDGVRVPLLRAGFRPAGPYTVTFVYLHDGMPFRDKGRARIALPRMDIPVSLTEWEVFVPERYRIRTRGGNAIARHEFERDGSLLRSDVPLVVVRRGAHRSVPATGGPRIHGRVRDASGAAIPGVSVQATGPALSGALRSAVTDEQGAYEIAALPPGDYTLRFNLQGFATVLHESVAVRERLSAELDTTLAVGNLREAVMVSADAPAFTLSGSLGESEARRSMEGLSQGRLQLPSQNVINLQQRAAGVLPVRVDIPRAGISHRFVRTLVVDDETALEFDYRKR
jgi:hypothetical protein